MRTIKFYTPADGSLTEEIDRTTGRPVGAIHLTWSYASILTAAFARAQAMGDTTYITQLAALGAAPNAAGVYGGPRACDTNASILFEVLATTQLGDTIFLTGNNSLLGNWNPSAGVQLNATNYTQSNPEWSGTVNGFELGEGIAFKYVRVDSEGNDNWEADPNREIAAPSACRAMGTERDVFQT